MRNIALVLIALSLVGCNSEETNSVHQNTKKTDNTSFEDTNHAEQNMGSENSHIPTCSSTQTLTVKEVLKVSDGDTLQVKDIDNSKHTIRLLGIDAPENKQTFGAQSTLTLKKCIENTDIVIEKHGKDVYGRILGKVFANGVDCNANQVAVGSAWHFKRYASNQSEYDDAWYHNLEVQARKQAQGLWSQATPQAPWDYRRNLETKTDFNEELKELEQLSQCIKADNSSYKELTPTPVSLVDKPLQTEPSAPEDEKSTSDSVNTNDDPAVTSKDDIQDTIPPAEIPVEGFCLVNMRGNDIIKDSKSDCSKSKSKQEDYADKPDWY